MQFKDFGVLRHAEVELTHGKRVARAVAVWASPNRVTAAVDAKLKSVDGLFLTEAAFMLRLHPKPADADKSIV